MNLITKHGKVIAYNKNNGEELFKSKGQVKALKKHYMDKIEEKLQENGMFLDELSEAQRSILGFLVYNTAPTGIQTISVDTLVEKTGYSRSTVCRAKKAIVEIGIFKVGYLGNGQKGKYVFVLPIHKNYENIMLNIFGIDVKNNNDMSCDTSNDTSSNSEIPCESKAEEPKQVSTLYTLNTLNSIKKEKENQSVINDNQSIDKTFLPEYIPSYFADATAPFLELKEVEELYQIVVRTFNKYASHPMMLEGMEEEIVKSFRVTIYKARTGQVKKQFKDMKQFFVAVLKNEISDANRQMYKEENPHLFYNWLEDNTEDFWFTSNKQEEAPVYPEWQLQGFNSEQEYVQYCKDHEDDMPY